MLLPPPSPARAPAAAGRDSDELLSPAPTHSQGTKHFPLKGVLNLEFGHAPQAQEELGGLEGQPQVSVRAEGPGVVRVKRVAPEARLLGFKTLVCSAICGPQAQSSGFFERGIG